MEVVVLAGAGAVLLALTALLLILGAPAFVRLFDATVGRLPVVGGYVGHIMAAALGVATSGIRLWADSVVDPLTTWLWHLTSRPWLLLNQLAGTLGSMATATGRVALRLSATATSLLHQAQHLYNLSIAYTVSKVAAVLHEAQHLYNLSIAYTVAKVGAVLHEAQHLYNLSIAYTVAKVAAVEAKVAAEVKPLLGVGASVLSQAESFASAQVAGLAGTVARDVGSLGSQVESVAASIPGVAATVAAGAVTAEVDQIGRALHDLVQGPWEALLPEVQAITLGLGADVASAIPGLEGLTGVVPDTLPAILALLVPALAAVATETARCGVPLCRNLSGLSNVLGTLAQEASVVALFGAVAYAAHDPAGAAGEVDQILGSVVRDLGDGLLSLIGDL